MRRPLLVLAALAAAVALAACGRPQGQVADLPTGPLTKDEYVDAFEASATGLAQRYGVDDKARDTTDAQEADRVARLQRLLRAWADRLAGLQPPAEARRAHARYVAGVRGFATDLDRARTALRQGDRAGADRLLSTGRIVSARTRADLVAARRAFHELGYEIRNVDTAPVETQ
jgi:hypothetical protein